MGGVNVHELCSKQFLAADIFRHGYTERHRMFNTYPSRASAFNLVAVGEQSPSLSERRPSLRHLKNRLLDGDDFSSDGEEVTLQFTSDNLRYFVLYVPRTCSLA